MFLMLLTITLDVNFSKLFCHKIHKCICLLQLRGTTLKIWTFSSREYPLYTEIKCLFMGQIHFQMLDQVD